MKVTKISLSKIPGFITDEESQPEVKEFTSREELF